jgi:hypothetical protein
MAAELGPPHAGRAVDVRDAAVLREALSGQQVAVACAGPFTAEATALLLQACLDLGCHYADIAEERASLETVRAFGPRLADRGLCALYGCSSLPGLSVPLALEARRAGPAAAPGRARVTLFIGNDNAKGPAAVASLLAQMGRPIAAGVGRVGTVRGLGGCARVPLPPPIGPRTAGDFDGPEHDVLPRLIGVASVEVKVAFELPLANRALSLLASLGLKAGARGARWLARLGNLTRWSGTSAGAVMAELFWDTGQCCSAALVAERDGQRMAGLPCALAVSALAGGRAAAGARLPHELLGGPKLLEGLAREGFVLHRA